MSMSARRKLRVGSAVSSMGLQPGGSAFYPYYIGEGTVYTRSVSFMPLATNSAAIATHLSQTHPYGVTTIVHTTDYNLPVYLVDSNNPTTPKTTVNYSSYSAGWGGPTQSMIDMLFTSDIPIPIWAQSANGTDHSMAIYDIATGIMREYWVMEKQGNGTWLASWGGYATDLRDMAATNYACQHTEGSDFACRNISALTQIGVEEARRGVINHALGVVLYDTAAWPAYSWPALSTDGNDSNVNAAAEGQWFRLPPSLNVDSLGLSPFLTMICKAVQRYGGFPCDKSNYAHCFNCEPGFNEAHVTGVDPWDVGGDVYTQYAGNFDVDAFPWHLTEWAPVDWGKP